MKPFNFFTIAICLFLASCASAPDADSYLLQAETAVARGDIETATDAADEIADESHIDDLSAKQLARLSIIYMQIADSGEQDEQVGSAADCYRRAFSVNADSAADYYISLPPQKAQFAMVLSSIVGNHVNPDNQAHTDTIFDNCTPSDTIVL